MKTIFASAFIFLSVCVAAQTKTTKHKKASSFTITIQTTSCYGKCPVYTLTIYCKGKMTLKGDKNLDKIGSYERSITKTELSALKKEFADIKFFELNDKYDSKATDLPTTYIKYELNGKVKTIQDYDGAPASLKKLEQKIEEYVKATDWKKVN